jgi:hypothetical protein
MEAAAAPAASPAAAAASAPDLPAASDGSGSSAFSGAAAAPDVNDRLAAVLLSPHTLTEKPHVTAADGGEEAVLTGPQLTGILTRCVPGVDLMMDRTGETPVAVFIISTCTTGLPIYGESPVVQLHTIHAIRFIFDCAAQEKTGSASALQRLAESFQSCQAEQGRTIDALYGRLSGRDASLRDQLLAVVDGYKAMVMQKVVLALNPGSAETDDDNPAAQVPHITSAYLLAVGAEFGFRGVAAARADMLVRYRCRARRVGRGAAGSSTTAEQLTDAEAAAPSEEEEEEETSTAAASEKSIMVEAIVDRAKNIHSDPRATAPILLLVGPPGVGKTSLGVSVARALGRKFQRIALGGVQDEAELRGHRRTYIGSMPGRIVQALRRAGTSNPVILLDEVDKIGRGSIRGDPAAALLEILDPAQNSTFRDAYLDVPVDCSGVLFLATANSLEPIPAPLLDRTEVLRIPGYTLEEKLNIARNYLVPKQLEVHSIAGAVTFADDALAKLATDHTREAGVRGLERSVAAVCRHVALAIAEEQSSDQLVEEVEEEEVEVQGGGERTAVVASRLREFFPPDII